LVEIIYNSAKSIFNLLENLLQWSRAQTGTLKFSPENQNLKSVVEENVELVKNMLKQKNIELNMNIKNDISIFVDQNMINAIIRNLLTNSIKFTEAGKINISATQNDKNVTMVITDTGIGMPQEKVNKIFEVEKSKSTEGTRGEQGSGLGLIICKEFVEKNGGKIYVKSDEGKGSTFEVVLPCK
jgi:signal transduction histidine kinase